MLFVAAWYACGDISFTFVCVAGGRDVDEIDELWQQISRSGVLRTGHNLEA